MISIPWYFSGGFAVTLGQEKETPGLRKVTLDWDAETLGSDAETLGLKLV